MRQIILRTIGLSLALGATDACAAMPGGADILIISDNNSGHAIHDLGLLPPPPNSDNPTPAPASASTVERSEAAPIPELPTWAMMLLCLMGLGLAGFKKGRKDRLSPGIE
jgi:hypothetical protein